MRAEGIRTALIYGAVPVIDRHPIIERFRDSDEFTVLLSSDVGSEGIDLQFCHVLFNYDLPWNPMKVEQRIGRVDRFGQRSPRISIYNFVASGTIEDRIYARLYERIRIFEESVGDLEAILGEIMRDLTRKVYRKQLSPREEIRLANQAADTVLRKKQELEEFDKHRLEFLGQDRIFEQELHDAVKSGRFVSPQEVHALVSTYLRSKFPNTHLGRNKGDDTWCLEPSPDFAAALRQQILKIGPFDRSFMDFFHRLRDRRQIPVTFSDEIAYERKLAEFVNLRHPLARAAVAFWEGKPHTPYPILVALLGWPHRKVVGSTYSSSPSAPTPYGSKRE
ncbi:helicase-related protein [Chloroflexota bacterium]